MKHFVLFHCAQRLPDAALATSHALHSRVDSRGGRRDPRRRHRRPRPSVPPLSLGSGRAPLRRPRPGCRRAAPEPTFPAGVFRTRARPPRVRRRRAGWRRRRSWRRRKPGTPRWPRSRLETLLGLPAWSRPARRTSRPSPRWLASLSARARRRSRAYAGGPVLGRPRLGERLDGRLGGAVGGEAVHADRGGHRRDTDDRPPALGRHLRRDHGGQEEGGLHVDGDGGVEVGLGQLVGGTAREDPGVVDQDIDGPASSPRRLTSS